MGVYLGSLSQELINMFGIVVFASLIVASLQTGIYYEEAAPVHHDPYRPNAPAHGDVHVSGSYQHEGEVHVSGHGAARVVDSGNSYHDAYPTHHAPAYPTQHAPAYPAPVRHHEAYDPHRPNSHASGDVNVSGNYKQEGEVHVSGSGASRVVAAGNSYHDSPVHPAPAYPAHPAPVYPPHPAPAYPVPARHAPAYPAPAHHAPSHD